MLVRLDRKSRFSEPMGKNDIWIILCDIIVETLGVDHDELVREAHLVKHLACS